MTYEIVWTAKFKKDYKLAVRRHLNYYEGCVRIPKRELQTEFEKNVIRFIGAKLVM